MTSLDPMDITWTMRRAPRAVVKVLHAHPGKVMLAGGFIRACIANETANDVDLFACDADLAKLAAIELLPNGTPPSELHETVNAYTVNSKLPMQVIKRWTFNSPEKLVESFDFTIARAAIWWDATTESWASLADEQFYTDLAAKRLRYCSPVREEEAGGSMLRVLKFYQRGYRIPLDCLAAVMSRMVVKLEPRRLGELGGWSEAAIEQVLTGLLVEVDPLATGVMAHMPATKEAA